MSSGQGLSWLGAALSASSLTLWTPTKVNYDLSVSQWLMLGVEGCRLVVEKMVCVSCLELSGLKLGLTDPGYDGQYTRICMTTGVVLND